MRSVEDEGTARSGFMSSAVRKNVDGASLRPRECEIFGCGVADITYPAIR